MIGHAESAISHCNGCYKNSTDLDEIVKALNHSLGNLSTSETSRIDPDTIPGNIFISRPLLVLLIHFALCIRNRGGATHFNPEYNWMSNTF